MCHSEPQIVDDPSDQGLSALSRSEIAIQSGTAADMALASDLLDHCYRNPELLKNHLDRCRYTIARAIVFSNHGQNDHAAAHARLVLHFQASLSSLPNEWTAKTYESWRWDICRRHLKQMRLFSTLAPDFVFLKDASGFVTLPLEELCDDLRLDKSFAERFGKPKPLGIEICSLLLDYQREFLEKGPDFLRPLTMKEVAQRLGVALSTVTRFIDGKSAQTPHGRFDLHFFFQRAARAVEKSVLSTVHRAIDEIIAGEDSKKPVTDQRIKALLSEKGVKVSRRTVAKYREILKIPNTHVRRGGVTEQHNG